MMMIARPTRVCTRLSALMESTRLNVFVNLAMKVHYVRQILMIVHPTLVLMVANVKISSTGEMHGLRLCLKLRLNLDYRLLVIPTKCRSGGRY